MLEISDFGDWKLKGKLGGGGFGEVLLWKHRLSNQEIATKRCLRDRRQMHDDEIEKLKSRWKLEHQWMLNVNIEYIVRGITIEDQAFVQYLNQAHDDWRPLPVIIMEYCNGGDLRSILRKPENINGLSEFEVREVMNALRHAIDYLHSVCKIEHRDLKPDNIVIHCVGNKKIYKLTDFGFCRAVMDQTAVASIVGTQNYIAPEIVDTSKYTKTVDYWSMGIIAFELMCGILPFIPHQQLFHKITNIKLKPPSCIAIQEDPTQNGKFHFVHTIFKENYMSRPFQLKMENWLRMSLDKDYRTRGKDQIRDQLKRPIGDLKIFTELDCILQSKILTVFCLNTYQFYAFEVYHNMSMPDLLEEMERETRVPKNTYYLILPTGHPHRLINASTRPIDLFVESWKNNAADSGNPAVMIYLLSYQSDYNAPDPYVSNLIKLFLKDLNLLPWAEQQVVAHTHFMLNVEQRHLESLLRGLHEYALQVDNDIFHFEGDIGVMKEKILIIDGRVRQFQTMLAESQNACQNVYSTFFKDWQIESEKITSKLTDIKNIGQNVIKRYSSVCRRIKEQAMDKYFNDTCSEDIYNLKKFRKWQQNPTDSIATRCKEAIYNCMDQRHKFINSQKLTNVKCTISDVHQEFRKICDIVKNAAIYMESFETDLTRSTAKFQKELLEQSRLLSSSVNNINQQLSVLRMDGSDFTPQNGDCPSLDEILNLPSTTELLENNRQQLLLFERMIDDDAIPMTINID